MSPEHHDGFIEVTMTRTQTVLMTVAELRELAARTDLMPEPLARHVSTAEHVWPRLEAWFALGEGEHTVTFDARML